MPRTGPSAFKLYLLKSSQPVEVYYYFAPFEDEETEASRRDVICSWAQANHRVRILTQV